VLVYSASVLSTQVIKQIEYRIHRKQNLSLRIEYVSMYYE